MRINTLFYTIKEGFVSIVRNAWFSLASIATISACLFLFGLFYTVLLNFQYVVTAAGEGVAVTVFFDEGIEDARIKEIGSLINKRTEVDATKTNFVSDDEAWATFAPEYLGEYAEGYMENPLEGSSHYEVYLNDVSLQKSLVEYLNTVEGVRRVNHSAITADTLTGINSMIVSISGGIIGILLAVSIFLISNTVTIGISIRKEEIQIMKYIGATDFFVRSPFVVEGMLIGIIGSLFPLTLIYLLYNEVIAYVMSSFDMLSGILKFLPVEDIFVNLVPISLAIGVGIGFIGSFTTVRKHLKV